MAVDYGCKNPTSAKHTKSGKIDSYVRTCGNCNKKCFGTIGRKHLQLADVIVARKREDERKAVLAAVQNATF